MLNIDTKKLKWPFLLLFLLISVITVSSLGIISALSRQHRQNTEMNARWSEQLKRLMAVEKSASAMNAPGNDIFESNNLNLETERLEKSIHEFDQAFDLYYEGLSTDRWLASNANVENAKKMKTLANEMITNSYLIFHHFKKKQSRFAVAQMSEMDRKFSQFLLAASEARNSILLSNENYIATQVITSNGMERFAYFSTAVMILFLCGLGFYSYKVVGFVKEAENSALKSQNFLTSFLDHSPSVMFAKDPQGRFRLLNSEFEKLFSVHRSDVLGSANPSTLKKDITDQLGKKDKEVIKNLRSHTQEEEFVFAEEEKRNFLSTTFPLLDKNGKKLGVGGILTDITEQRKTENALKQKNFALDQSAIVAITDRRGIITFANDNFCRISGYSREELVGQDHRLLNSGLHNQEFFAELWGTIRAGHVWRGEIRNQAKDGSYYWVASTITPLRDLSGNVSQFVSIRYDITNRKLVEEDLDRAKEAALSAARVKAEFLANMSHEIRTPMNGVIGICNLLLDEENNTGKIEKLKIIQNCGSTLLDLINDILDFSKLEVEKVELDKQSFNLQKVILEVIDLLNIRASEKGIVLAYTPGPQLPEWVSGDATRIKQILMNLLSNALKFTEKGRIDLHCQLRSNCSNKYELEFAVKDTGIGVPDHVKEKLFRPFSQVDASTARKYGGTGLGLAICKGLCEKMDGKIWLESIVGKGSTFFFTLQLDAVETIPLIDSNNPFTNFDGQLAKKIPLQILVAEDNRVNQVVAIGILRKLGYEADIASNGVEVMAALSRKSYDLIFMDCHMPEMDGYEATEKIRQSAGETWSKIKIIALTASTLKQDIERCKACGMDDFVGKPIQLSEILRVFQQHFSESQKKSA